MRGMEWISQSRLICKLYQLFFKYWKKYQSLACFNTDNLFENSSLLKEITSSPQSSENLKYQTVQILQGGGCVNFYMFPILWINAVVAQVWKDTGKLLF